MAQVQMGITFRDALVKVLHFNQGGVTHGEV